jgi:predicted DNA-binding transcriptional regulator AlpA
MKTLARDKKKVLFSFEHVSRETGLATATLKAMAAAGQLEVIPCNRVTRMPGSRARAAHRHADRGREVTADEDQLLDQDGAAALLGCSARTLERWRAERSGPPFIKLSPRAIRYSRKALLLWLSERTVTA